MKGNPEERAAALAEYMIRTGKTVRATADVFGVSKSTVHKDVTVRLRRVDVGLWRQVSEVLHKNKAERHLRGGEATRHKYHPTPTNPKT